MRCGYTRLLTIQQIACVASVQLVCLLSSAIVDALVYRVDSRVFVLYTVFMIVLKKKGHPFFRLGAGITLKTRVNTLRYTIVFAISVFVTRGMSSLETALL